ncbi:MAG: hypothetical protein ISS47_01800 [Candidatus Omnitrophica bacterium]|nr:hypothetical protein [Candidatus Omnitrophota bacterium]
MKKIKKYRYWLLIIILITFQSINNYFWIKQDCESMGWDVCNHINIVASLNQEFKNEFVSNISFVEKFESIYFLFTKDYMQWPLSWPPLVHFIAALSSLMFKDTLFFSDFLICFIL